MWKAINLSAAYGDEPLFADASFAVGDTDRVGLVGPNGAGKSTMLKIVAGELRPTAGHIEFPPGTRVGYFAQQVPDPAVCVGEYLDTAPGELPALDRRLRALHAEVGTDPGRLAELGAVQERYGQLGGWAYSARVAEVRDRLGVSALPDDTRLGTLSGGEQARLMLARVLVGDPTDLLLDEPTNHLDADGINWLGGYLARFSGSIVVVTHDRALLDRVATRIVDIDGIGGPGADARPQFYDGGYTAYRAEKQRRWERWLLDFEAQEKARARLAEDIETTKGHALATELTTRNDRMRRYAKKVAAKAKARERRLVRQMEAATWIAEPQTRPPLVLAFRSSRADSSPADATAATVLSASRLTLMAGTRRLARDVDLHLREGERVVLTGPNGAGKTTLLNTLAGIAEPAAGRVDRRGVVVLLPQTHDELRLRTPVLDFFRSRVPVYIDEAEELLRAYLFDNERQRQPLRTLSAGEMRRLLLATIVNSDADAILLDEPTNFLDFDALDVVEEALRAYDGALLVVTHDAYLPKSIGCNRHIVLANGQLTDRDRGV